ncbi:endonuclease [Aureococcus anophagefferens]|nr:endonuclease [Aureococcus anophagefferens]
MENVIFLLVSIVIATCSGCVFTERIVTTIADGARGVFVTDVDGDGDVDALSASAYDDTIAWYENDGSQSFTERVITTLADSAFSVFAIDVDGDGDVDALSASANDHSVAWYENDGSQSFTERVITALADHPRSVFAIDVDGDGDVDALSAVRNDDTVAWYENDGAQPFQSFTERIITASAMQAACVFAIDVDDDGDVDVLSASYNDDTVAWYENDGSQSFAEGVITAAAIEAWFVYAIDVDGDGDVDALSASAYDDTIAWYENDGSHASERVVLYGSAAPSSLGAETDPSLELNTTWSLVSGLFSGDAGLEETARTSVAVRGPAVARDHVLVLPAGALVPGGHYSLRLSATYGGSSTPGVATVSFVAALAPTSGALSSATAPRASTGPVPRRASSAERGARGWRMGAGCEATVVSTAPAVVTCACLVDYAAASDCALKSDRLASVAAYVGTAGAAVDLRRSRVRAYFESRRPVELIVAGGKTFRRFAELMRTEHPIAALFARDRFVSRRAKVSKLGLEVLMFLASCVLESALYYPDPGCEDETSRNGCLKYKNLAFAVFKPRDMCVWSTCAGACAYREPDRADSQSVQHYFALGASLAVLLPLVAVLDRLVETYLEAPNPFRAAAAGRGDAEAPEAPPESARPPAEGGGGDASRVSAWLSSLKDLRFVGGAAPADGFDGRPAERLSERGSRRTRLKEARKVATYVRRRMGGASRRPGGAPRARCGAGGARESNKRSALWMQDAAVSLCLYYGVIATIEVYFFGIALPSLLDEYFTKFDDPTAVRQFPFETRLPELSTFFLAHWHDDLRGTRIGKHCLGVLETRNDEYDGAPPPRPCVLSFAPGSAPSPGSLNALRRIYADQTWRPSPAVRLGIFLASSFVLLPPSIQEVLFEELFTAAPVISYVLFQGHLDRFSDGASGGRRSVNVGVAINFAGVFLLLLAVYFLMAAFKAAVDACAKRAYEEDEHDRSKWYERERESLDEPVELESLAKRGEIRSRFRKIKRVITLAPRSNAPAGDVELPPAGEFSTENPMGRSARRAAGAAADASHDAWPTARRVGAV